MIKVACNEQICELLRTGTPYNEILKRLGCSKSTVHQYARVLGLTKPGKFYDWSAVQEYYDAGHTRLECMAHFGFCFDSWRSAMRRGDLKVKDWRIPLDNLLVPNRHQTARSHLKQRLLQAGLLQNHCYECGINEWRGNSISLNLHHINGDGKDNRLENLTLLCPNCHSQTENFAGKNKTGETKRLYERKNLYAGETL